MAFKKKTWKDRLVEFAGRRTLKRISGSADSQMVVDVTRNEGTVSQAGDAFSAANMNDLEQRIADEFSSINNNLGGLSFYEDASGKYVVGADSVPKKLGSLEVNIPFSLNTGTIANSALCNYYINNSEGKIKSITFTSFQVHSGQGRYNFYINGVDKMAFNKQIELPTTSNIRIYIQHIDTAGSSTGVTISGYLTISA